MVANKHSPQKLTPVVSQRLIRELDPSCWSPYKNTMTFSCSVRVYLVEGVSSLRLPRRGYYYLHKFSAHLRWLRLIFPSCESWITGRSVWDHFAFYNRCPEFTSSGAGCPVHRRLNNPLCPKWRELPECTDLVSARECGNHTTSV